MTNGIRKGIIHTEKLPVNTQYHMSPSVTFSQLEEAPSPWKRASLAPAPSNNMRWISAIPPPGYCKN